MINEYLKNNAFPIIIEIILIISFLVLPNKYHIYTNTLFYLLLFAYIIYKKEFSINEWISKLKSGKEFWKKTLFTILGFIIALFISILLENALPHLDTGAIILHVNNLFSFLCFILSTILLPAITEEIIFRKNMIYFDKNKLLVTTLISMFLFSLEHFLSLWGLLLGIIWAIPLTISYIKTKDIYVAITAHFIISLLGNGVDVINLFLKILN